MPLCIKGKFYAKVVVVYITTAFYAIEFGVKWRVFSVKIRTLIHNFDEVGQKLHEVGQLLYEVGQLLDEVDPLFYEVGQLLDEVVPLFYEVGQLLDEVSPLTL